MTGHLLQDACHIFWSDVLLLSKCCPPFAIAEPYFIGKNQSNCDKSLNSLCLKYGDFVKNAIGIEYTE